ncbi:MAG: hypothetical protein IID44_15765 [Planctomycetes bacterium]|nr:hypothetical protein [Planctomycetota bacterium]
MHPTTGQHEQFGSRFTPKSTANGSRFAQPDSIPDSFPSDNNFGSQGTVTLPLPKSDFGQTEFDSRGVSDRARAEAPDYSTAMGRAQDLMDQNRLAEALGLLSQLYEHPKLSDGRTPRTQRAARPTGRHRGLLERLFRRRPTL